MIYKVSSGQWTDWIDLRSVAGNPIQISVIVPGGGSAPLQTANDETPVTKADARTVQTFTASETLVGPAPLPSFIRGGNAGAGEVVWSVGHGVGADGRPHPVGPETRTFGGGA